MKVIESFLEKAWGDSVDNPKIEDIEVAIKETQEMDDEHGAFWVGVFGEDDKEIVLEVSKYLTQTLILDPENSNPETFNEKRSRAENWEEILQNFKLLLNGEIDEILSRITK
ncbi:hypothetical protein [uncultured Psychroserpens sp.]|uniref:hypothetical protein n=1 Tax=uncultured Psychroserpens sp. TaxID=255436 RepID=UPI002608F09C|nr:hypothetical protein [uncultured Psychroserpens sp.]